MFVTFQYRGLHHLDMHCTLIIEAGGGGGGGVNQTFILIADICNYEIHVYLV